MASARIFVVTGSNKGIGLAAVQGICKNVGSEGIVYLTARSVERGTKAVEELKSAGLNPRFHQMDVSDASSINAFAKYLKEEHGGLDVLVNNAAIAYKGNATEPFGEQARETIKVNYFGLKAVCDALFPLLRPHARVVNVSSCVGHLSKVPGKELRDKLASDTLTVPQLDDIVDEFVKLAETGKHQEAGWQNSAYGASKIAVSALTRIQHRQLSADSREDIVINHTHPGYVDTDMTSHKGPLSPEKGAVSSVYLALLPAGTSSPKGDYIWHDKTVVDWVNGPLPAPGY